MRIEIERGITRFARFSSDNRTIQPHNHYTKNDDLCVAGMMGASTPLATVIPNHKNSVVEGQVKNLNTKYFLLNTIITFY